MKRIMEAIEKSAVDVLRSFFKEVDGWNVKQSKIYTAEGVIPSVLEKARSDLAVIYKNYVTPRERKTGRLATLGASSLPVHDEKDETITSIEQVSKNKIVIHTAWKEPALGFYHENRRYTLTFRNKKCLLDKMERFSSMKNKWINEPL
ncbi:MAG: RhsIA family immunity protein [Rhodanobacter sp.]|jgi:hypothetical protein|nr:RhsIA family immunity protein [Rhodanobacter sp.]